MKLSAQARQELLALSNTDDFAKLRKILFAETPDAEQATKQFTDFIQMVHKMAGHPVKKHKAMTGTFLL